MPELPKSFGLEQTKIADRDVLVGKDINGEAYIARTLDQPGVTEQDVQDLVAMNPDNPNREEALRQRLLGDIERNQKAFEDQVEKDFEEPAERVAYAGLHREGLSIGSTRAYRAKFDDIQW